MLNYVTMIVLCLFSVYFHGVAFAAGPDHSDFTPPNIQQLNGKSFKKVCLDCHNANYRFFDRSKPFAYSGSSYYVKNDSMLAFAAATFATNVISMNAVEYIELSSLEHGDKKLSLAWKIDHGDYISDPDGTKFYSTKIVISVTGKDGKENTNVADGIYTSGKTDGGGTPCIILDPKSGVVSVFISVKPRPNTYAMDGYVYRKSEGSGWIKEKVFENKNWGWFAFFGGSDRGNPILCHFAFAGYFAIETKRNSDGSWSSEKVGKITPDTASSQYLSHKNVLVADTSNNDRMTNVYSKSQTTSSMPDSEMMKTMLVLGLFGKVVESVGNAFSAAVSSSSSSSANYSATPSTASFCNSGDTCFEAVKYIDSAEVKIRCTKGSRIGTEKNICSNGKKWATGCGISDSFAHHYSFSEAGNLACGY